MRAGITALILSLIAGLSASKPIDFTDKTVDCSDPNGYSVVEVRDTAANYVNIERGGMVLWSIKLPTGMDRNGFGFNWAKKTKDGFEVSVEYGSSVPTPLNQRVRSMRTANDRSNARRIQVNKIIAALANVLLVLIVCVPYAPAQEPSAPKPTPDSSSATTKTDPPKNEVEQTLDEAKKNGDKVLTLCLEDCDNSKDLITSGVEVGHVIELPQPEYPALAGRAHVSGQVQVQLVIGLEGEVIAAHAISGHPLLQASAVSAARKARFTPTLLEGKPVKVTGVIVYNFVRP